MSVPTAGSPRTGLLAVPWGGLFALMTNHGGASIIFGPFSTCYFHLVIRGHVIHQTLTVFRVLKVSNSGTCQSASILLVLHPTHHRQETCYLSKSAGKVPKDDEICNPYGCSEMPTT
ncbi:hypothetical protein ARMSODRAFT_133567 [Armillaria solidipes]|uniref:Uncharacterized protein n=1 Tax=Armillaria solidipes TaxID=1076256 RepID=A0A2H3B5U6_9AGAR|nr:hypothetical protein ARMSODRAFT_133567 [Armillaria solidipes]